LERQWFSLLQQLNRYLIRRPNKGHSTIPWGSKNGHTIVLKVPTQGIDVVHGIGNMAEISPTSIGFSLVPIVGQFQRGLIALGGQENKGETTPLGVLPTKLLEPHETKEVNGCIEVENPNHRV